MNYREHERLEQKDLLEISVKLIDMTTKEMESNGEGRSKLMMVLPPPSTDAMLIYPAMMGHNHPRESMPFIKSMIKGAEKENGVGVIAALACVAEAWMVRIEKTEATFVDLKTIPPPSEHPNKVEVVICTVFTPHGDSVIRVYETVRDEDGAFVRLDDWQVISGAEEVDPHSIFNPWEEFDPDGIDGISW